ncbi:MAG TPA: endonuclease/exonuclease/phosphatase family protein, partial [Thermoanaerobaculia bacterium]|nr:endonuclease/exonuclease/phosphatase family protein [Thermoanaerobaculia bacterium]
QDRQDCLSPHVRNGTVLATAQHGMTVLRRIVLVIVVIVLLWFAYRALAVYRFRNGCDARDADKGPPSHDGLPAQTRPLVVMTYNIAGHDELIDGAHIQKIAAVIRAVKPDIVGLQEVHRKTWQSRFRDQAKELQAATGLNLFFGPSFSEAGGGFGNAILTRGDILSAAVHPLPVKGEPRSMIESVVRIDGVTLNIYVTHLSAWGKLAAHSRGQQLSCLATHIRNSPHPYLLLGDFNAPPDRDEIQAFRKLDAAQICGEDIGITLPSLHERIDYIWSDPGWRVVSTEVVKSGPSDHYPVVAQLFWRR